MLLYAVDIGTIAHDWKKERTNLIEGKTREQSSVKLLGFTGFKM